MACIDLNALTRKDEDSGEYDACSEIARGFCRDEEVNVEEICYRSYRISLAEKDGSVIVVKRFFEREVREWLGSGWWRRYLRVLRD